MSLRRDDVAASASGSRRAGSSRVELEATSDGPRAVLAIVLLRQGALRG
jgi:hypothetical protein